MKSSEEVEQGGDGEAGEVFVMDGKAGEVVGAGGGEVVDGGTRGRRWEGWAAGCGMGIDGDQLALWIKNPQVAGTSEQSKQHQCETLKIAEDLLHLVKRRLVVWEA